MPNAAVQTSPARYFMRQHMIDGALVPTTLLRRVTDAQGTRDEVFRGPGRWTPDVNGTVDRALRFPLDTDLEEISEQQAMEIQRSVAAER